jgi:hypothetical protein
MRIASLFLAAALWFSTPSSAQDDCSLIVKVRTPDGRRPHAPVSVKEQNGRTQELEQDGDDVRFCGLGILPVTVTVGNDSVCNQVVVHDVPVAWNRTYLLHVTYDPEACRERVPPPEPACEILFRVRNPAGAPVPGAVVSLTSPIAKSFVADRFGRADIVLRATSHVAGSASGAGLRAAGFAFDCSRLEPEHEENIGLAAR